jgi:hypothetical protein
MRTWDDDRRPPDPSVPGALLAMLVYGFVAGAIVGALLW